MNIRGFRTAWLTASRRLPSIDFTTHGPAQRHEARMFAAASRPACPLLALEAALNGFAMPPLRRMVSQPKQAVALGLHAGDNGMTSKSRRPSHLGSPAGRGPRRHDQGVVSVPRWTATAVAAMSGGTSRPGEIPCRVAFLMVNCADAVRKRRRKTPGNGLLSRMPGKPTRCTGQDLLSLRQAGHRKGPRICLRSKGRGSTPDMANPDRRMLA